jgi:hypothetical protein
MMINLDSRVMCCEYLQVLITMLNFVVGKEAVQEHVRELALVLKEVHRILKLGGQFFSVIFLYAFISCVTAWLSALHITGD